MPASQLRRRLLVGPALDIALEHAVLEALLFVDRLGHVMEGDDAEQRPALLDRNVALVALEHDAPQLHDLEPGSGDDRIALVDLAHLEIAELPVPLSQRPEHLGEGEHPQHLTVIHDYQGPYVELR